MITNPMNKEANMTPGSPALDADLVRRHEFTAVIESLNRELSGYTHSQGAMNAKLDQILAGKTSEALAMGQLQERVRRLGEDVSDQSKTIQRIEVDSKKTELAPRDALIRFAGDVFKLALAAGIGYLLRKP